MAQISRQPSLASQHAPSIRSQKPPLPHVSTLWQSVELSNRNTFDARKTLSSQRPSKQRSTPSSPSSAFVDLRNTPNIHLLAMPELGNEGPGEFKPAKAQHRRNNSSDIHSPSSTRADSIHNGSIFELPTMPNESPNSSIRTSFLAELEDTSGLDYSPVPPMPTQLSPPVNTSILLKNKLTSRAILEVVDATIAGIEAANRELLARAEAAEASAYRLHVSNTELRSRVEELSAHYRPKPAIEMKTRGTQTISRVPTPKHSPHASIDRSTSPILLPRASPTFNPNFNESQELRLLPPSSAPERPQAQISTQTQSQLQVPGREAETDHTAEDEKIPKPKSRRSMRSLKFLSRNHGDTFTLPLNNSSSATLNAKSSRASSDRPRTADGSTSPRQAVPPLPELPIFLSLTSHAVNGGTGGGTGKHTRTISFDEAKKLSAMQVPTSSHNSNGNGKKLTPPKFPIGEMSPSPVHGVVEIGMGMQDDEKDGGGESVKPLKSQRSRVRFLLKETMIRELIEGDREKKREKKERGDKEGGKGEKWEGQRKISGFFKRGKKGEEQMAIPVTD